MQRYTIFFIIVYVLHVLGSFSAHHHQERENCTRSIWYVSDAVCTVELLMMGGETARNM
jgi:hypothetical protein